MWSDTVGLTTRPVSDQNIGLGLGLARIGGGSIYKVGGPDAER